jgi:hypothetical protein
VFTSWKTTLGGIITAIGTLLTQMNDPTMKLIGGVMAAVGALLLGLAAKDHDVTGGIKKQ